MAKFPFISRHKHNSDVHELKEVIDNLVKIDSFKDLRKDQPYNLSRGSAMPMSSPLHPYYGDKLPGNITQTGKAADAYETTPRPLYRINPLQYAGVQYPTSPVNLFDLYNAAQASDTMEKVFNVFKRDLFRRGVIWRPTWLLSCQTCGTEYETLVESCEVCPDGGRLTKPDPREKSKFNRFIRRANDNGQTLVDVLRQLEDDLNTCDNAYLINRKKYLTSQAHEEYAPNGIIYSEVRELIRGDPLRMRIIGNARGTFGNKYWVCIDHRTIPEDKLQGGVTASDGIYNYGEMRSMVALYEQPGVCTQPITQVSEDGKIIKGICERPLHEVFYAATDGGFTIHEPYIAGEVIHAKRFSPSLMYGRSPMIGLWKDIITRLRMKQYLNEFFRYFRYPRGVLVANTDNPEGFYRFWDAQIDRLRYDSWYMPALAVEKRDGRGAIDFIKFTGTFEELQYKDNLEEAEQTIFKAFGVMETTADSNMGTTGLYLRLTPGAMMFHQETFEDNLLPRLLEQFHIYSWKLEILPTEEDDEMEILTIRLKNMEIAERALAMGQKVTYTPDGRYEISGDPQSQMDMMGGGIGLPGEESPSDLLSGEGGTGEDEETGENETDEIDALLQDLIGGESTKDKARAGNAKTPAKGKPPKDLKGKGSKGG